jgi:hypothetical protein
MDEIASFQQQVTPINLILSDLDLTAGLKDLKQCIVLCPSVPRSF